MINNKKKGGQFMRQCELERVVREKGNPKLKRTGEKLNSFVDGVTDGMSGAIIELKQNKGLWVVDKINNMEIPVMNLKRNWSVGLPEEDKDV